MTDTVRDLLMRLAEIQRPGLLFEDLSWTWAEYVAASTSLATGLSRLLDGDRPHHVAALLDNVPEMAFLVGAAGLGGPVLAGLNTTRRGEGLAADIAKAEAQLVVTSPDYLPLLPDDVRVMVTGTPEWTDLMSTLPSTAPEPTSDDLMMLIFTSGTSGDPKAVRITHDKVAIPGIMLADRFGLTADDVAYLSMPLFHSNAVMAGWAPAVAGGAAMALARRFSASCFLPDVRRYGATYANYVGKPLSYVMATPAAPDDADNPLRIVFGNEAAERDIAGFAERFGCVVVDSYGSTENAVIVQRTPDMPAGALGMPLPGVEVLDASGHRTPDAQFSPDGALVNADEAVGELVNTDGAGFFAGYHNDPDADAARMRDGMYWSGDLAYRDANGFVYFAGRTSDWLRVDGENLAAAPIERLLLRCPSVSMAAVYGVPSSDGVGDELMAALVLLPGASLDPSTFESFLVAQPDLGTKSWPRYVRITGALPVTPTNKVLKRQLAGEGTTTDDLVWARDQRGTSYSTDEFPARAESGLS